MPQRVHSAATRSSRPARSATVVTTTTSASTNAAIPGSCPSSRGSRIRRPRGARGRPARSAGGIKFCCWCMGVCVLIKSQKRSVSNGKIVLRCYFFFFTILKEFLGNLIMFVWETRKLILKSVYTRCDLKINF